MSIKIHSFHHVPFEGLGNIEDWIISKGHSFSSTRFYNHETLPNPEEIDWLIVMGGPMGAYEENNYPWLAAEKKFISQVIRRGIKVLGICLGAQLIAAALGAKVYPNKQKEIGWFPISLSEEGKTSAFFSGFPSELIAFHWHGDTFDLPDGAQHLAESVACRNQAFSYKNNVLSLQFHFDLKQSNLRELIKNCGNELRESPYIQTVEEMTAKNNQFIVLEEYMRKILDNFESGF
jgi:GMP synthase (glutamine-hydrolysing)